MLLLPPLRLQPEPDGGVNEKSVFCVITVNVLDSPILELCAAGDIERDTGSDFSFLPPQSLQAVENIKNITIAINPDFFRGFMILPGSI